MKKVTKRSWLGLLALVLGLSNITTVKAQEPVWSISAPEGGWFMTDGTARGLSYNPATGHLIVATRTPGLNPVLIDAATGDSVGVLDMTGVSGGLIPYVFIQATSDGQLFASNVVNSEVGVHKIYRWENETAAPTVIYEAAHGSTQRVGDSFKAYGTGNNISLLASGGSALVVKIAWDGTTATKTDYTVTNNIARGGFSSMVNDSTVWVTGTGTAPTLFDFKNGTLGASLTTPDAAMLPAATLNSAMTSDAFTYLGKSYLFLGPHSVDKKFWLINLTDNELVGATSAFSANTNSNNNGTVVVDKANGMAYVMMTNNVINAYKLTEFLGSAVFSEYFEYETGSLLTANGYAAHSGAGTNSIPVDETMLMYPGYAGNFGKSAKIVASGEDVNKTFGENFKTGKVYMSALVNASNASEAGEYFFHFVNSQGTGAEFRGRVSLKKNAEGALAFGISKAAGASTSTYTDFNYSLDKTNLIVLEYVRVEGDLNDIVNLYVNPVGSELPAVPTVSAADSDAGDIIELSNFAIRQGTNSPALLIGGIRVGTDYASVVGNPEEIIENTDVMVTFTLNLSTLADTAVAGDMVFINGGVKGPRGSDTFLDGETLGWDNNATATLTNVGGDYWQATYKLQKGDTLQYKYRFQNAGNTVNKDEQGILVPQAQNPNGWDTRFHIATKDTVLAVDYWQVEETANGITSGIPFATDKVDTVAIYFRVNVGAAIQAGEFNVETDSVGVRGTPEIFGNPGDWSATAFYLTKEENVSGENQMYSGTLYLNKDSVDVGNTYIYKFVTEIGANNDTQWDSDPNREFKGTLADTTIQYQYFQRKKPASEPLVDALLNFSVDVGILEGLGYFDAGVGDKVQVKGDFNGWAGTDPLTFDPIDFTWSLTGKNLKRVAGDKINYKFFIEYDASRFDEGSVNHLQGINKDFGYEEPGLTGGGNRVYEITSVGSPESQGPEHTFFNGVDPRGLIDKPIDVTFNVDMNPAKSHTDPFNPAVDTVYIRFQTNYFALVNGVSGELNSFDSETLEKLRLTDPDNDGVYSVTIPLAVPSPNHMGFVISYGQVLAESGRLVTTGSGFDAGRRYYQYIRPTLDGSGTVIWPDTYSMPVLQWKEKDLPWEPALDYDLLTSNESTNGIVHEFSLDQNYPNPFNPTTTIRFSLANAENVKLTVYNLLGQRVAILANNISMAAGQHAISFDASKLASGVYIYRIEAGSFNTSKKMTLIK
ncbi:T9SS type A sorting domain-containing protein [bacterium]|nr:MAG: T9SS type A sorting domain-containing protein [bacterium]